MAKDTSVTREDASSLEKSEQGIRRLSVVLDDLPDPDAGKSEEERKAIVSLTQLQNSQLTTARIESCYGRSILHLSRF